MSKRHWTTQDIANSGIRNDELLLKLNQMEVEANKQAKEDIEDGLTFHRKIPKDRPLDAIAEEDIRDLNYLIKADRIAVNSRLTPYQLEQRNSVALTPVDKEEIEFHRNATKNLNPNVANIAPPTIYDANAFSNNDWAGIDPEYDNSNNEKILIETEKKLKQGQVVLSNIKSKLAHAKSAREQNLLKTNLSKISDQVRNLMILSKIMSNRIEEVKKLRLFFVEKKVKPYNQHATEEYEKELQQLTSGNLSMERLLNESDADYVHRIDTNIKALLIDDQRMDATMYINREFVKLLTNLGFDMGISESISNQLETINKERILKSKELFKSKIQVMKPFYRLNTEDILNFIDNFQNENPIRENITMQVTQPTVVQGQVVQPEAEYISEYVPEELLTPVPQERELKPRVLFRETAPMDLEQSTVLTLRKYAKEHGIKIPAQARKYDIIAIIEQDQQYGQAHLNYGEFNPALQQAYSSMEMEPEIEPFNYPAPQESRVVVRQPRGKQQKKTHRIVMPSEEEWQETIPSVRPQKMLTEMTSYDFDKLNETGQGFKQHHSISHLKSHLALIESEVMAGNDNKKLLKEADNVLKAMLQMKLVTKAGKDKFIKQMKNYNK